VLSDGDVSCDAFDANERIGISITENLARMWGPHNEIDLFEDLAGEITPIAVVESNQVAVISDGLTPGSTIAAETSTAVLVAPTF
jgi:hypothetical protein